MSDFRFVITRESMFPAYCATHTRVFKDGVEVEDVRACSVQELGHAPNRRWHVDITYFSTARGSERFIADSITVEDLR